MPVEVQQRTSVGFKDLSMSFQKNPLSNDLIVLNHANAIAQAVKNLVLTDPGERFFNPDLGTGISESLFENVDVISASQIQVYVENTIRNYEPRVRLEEVVIVPDFDSGLFNVTVKYEIVGVDIPIQALAFPLVKTR
jgi:phage baseplate assembly protein W